MAGATSSVDGVLADFTTPTLPNIGGQPTKEALINLHRLVSGNAATVASNIRRGRYGHLALTIKRRGIHGTDGLRVCAAAQPRQLPTKNGSLPRASAWK